MERESRFPMWAVPEALSRVLNACVPLPAVRVPAREALGMSVASPLPSPAPFPPFAASVMDGMHICGWALLCFVA
jgi:molybdopterin biosynthesis enzyme